MLPPAHESTAPTELTPRRLASVRRLIASGIGILALMAVSELLLASLDARLAWFRGGLIVVMFGLWWFTRHVKTSRALASTVYLQLLLIAGGSSLSLFLEGNRLGAPLETMMLVIVVSGSAWPTLRYFVTGTLVCLGPMLIALAASGASAAVWSYYAMYLGAAVLVAYAMWRQRFLAARASARLRAELERRAIEDPMTAVLNRAGWNKQAPAALDAADASRRPVALLYLDLDHFKAINDRHGHAVGDTVIERAAQLIRGEVREHDLVARLGGEEFAVLLIGSEAARALVVAERIRTNFEREREPVPCSLCVGLAERLPGETLVSLMGRADAALLAAKRNGRNRIEQAVAPA